MVTADMGEIRQTIFNCKFSFSATRTPGNDMDIFMALSNPHDEDDLNGQSVKVVDFHGQKFSFGIPIGVLDSLRNESLLNKNGQYLNFEGCDVNGQTRGYSFLISTDLVSNLAYYIFTILCIDRGSDFTRENMTKWTDWMK